MPKRAEWFGISRTDVLDWLLVTCNGKLGYLAGSRQDELVGSGQERETGELGRMRGLLSEVERIVRERASGGWRRGFSPARA